MFDVIYSNPFFQKQTMLYQLTRNGEVLGTVRFLKGNGSITVWPESYNKIQVGDELSKDGDVLVITTVAVKSDDSEQYKIQTKHEYEREHGSITNIDNISQSQIAVGSSDISQSQSNHVTLKTIKDNAFDIKPEDQELFHELVDQLQQFESGKISLKKDSFSKYGKLLKDYLPLGLQVGEFIHLLFFGH